MASQLNFSTDPRCTWAPAESPVRIHYSPEALRGVRRQARGSEAVGVLFGSLSGSEIRIVTSRRLSGVNVAAAFRRVFADTTLAGLKPVGLFSSRTRGKVFLTENDLALFEWFRLPEAVALVVAGDAAGFFVRAADGTIQSIQSHQEFSLRTMRPSPLAPNRHRLPQSALAFAAVITVVLAVLAISIARRPLPPVPVPQGRTVFERVLARVPIPER